MSIQRPLIVAMLVALAAMGWFVLVRQGAGMALMTGTMRLSFGAFLAIWVVMMVAMMFPTAAPMILTFNGVQRRRVIGGGFVSTWIFVAGYLLLWALTGLAAYALAVGGEWAIAHFGISPAIAARIGGGILIGAGAYQVTPLKDICLSTCRTPLAFIMTSWRPGAAGAFRMGWRHGLYCFGCCWLLFVILFPLGMMNILAMAAITLLIFAEKTLPRGRWVSRVAAAVLVVYGGLVIARPALLPTFISMPSMAMTPGR